jgi:two-component system, OmpR family, copper resistance phosphate regulon response regulator CusR
MYYKSKPQIGRPPWLKFSSESDSFPSTRTVRSCSFVNLLIVEDDPKTARAVANGLIAAGFKVDVARDGDEGCVAIQKDSYDLLLLDWMLPGRDGIELIRILRTRGLKTPVLLLTARDALEDRVLGLESGADDYLVKPFAFAELLARINALLRRAGDTEPLRKRVGDLVLNVETREATRAGEAIALTPREFELLAYLMRHKGQTVTRAMLAKDVWREPQRATPIDNVIDVHVAHLRRKVDDTHETKLIHTVRGVGFVLREERT